MKRVGQMALREGMTVAEIVEEYEKAGALGAGTIAKAMKIYRKMLRDEATIFLGISGPMVPSGLRGVITDMIEEGYVNVIVTSGANIVHDMIEAFEGSHYVGSFHVDDAELRRGGMGRIGNIYTKMSDFEAFEKRVQEILAAIDKDKRENLSIRELVWEIGKRIDDRGSFLRAAYENEVSIFSPGIVDSMLGLQLWFFSQENEIVLNALKDMSELADIIFNAKKTGAVFLGGGLPKHYIMGANLLREGIDYGIQITLDREEAGSLSGAKLEEGRSWGKAQAESEVVTIIGDCTVIFPILISALKEELGS
ncbi:MAG: deoxyhypusine synthase [Candidatus Hydrothermarchaeales archaeon]